MEFVSFVERTWRELVTRETKDNEARPSIALFCRMDIGIRIDPFGKEPPAYFVNEVERSLNTSLWLRFHGKFMGTLADTFAMAFKQWMKDVRNPYIL